MRIPKSLVSFQKEANDKVSWHNIEKNIYDETVEITYTLRILGIPIYQYPKIIITRHSFENEKTMNRVSGFKTNDPK